MEGDLEEREMEIERKCWRKEVEEDDNKATAKKEFVSWRGRCRHFALYHSRPFHV